MRPVSTTLDAAQTARSRVPLARATVRDMRLRFARWGTITNPWGLADADQQQSHNYVYGDSVTLDDQSVVRVWAAAGGNLMVQTIPAASVGTLANWSHAVNPWVDAGFGVEDYTNPGLVSLGATARIFYRYFGVSETGIHWRDTDALGTDHFTGLNPFGSPAFSPISGEEGFAYLTNWQGHEDLGLVHFQNVAGVWSLDEAPFRLYGDRDHPLYLFGEHDSVTYADSFVLGGIAHFVYTFGPAGHSYVVRWQNGVWSEPRLLIPDDATTFAAYRATQIGDRVYLTGRVGRYNDPDNSPFWDAYLETADGLNWSALARDSFICLPEVRGKLLLSGDTLYYPGLSSVWKAPATFKLGVDPSPQKLTLIDELVSFSATFPAAGLSPSLELDVANASQAFTDSPVLADGSEIWLEAGYETTSGPEYVTLLHASIDTVQGAIADGTRSLAVSAREASVKKLHDWTSPFYWTLPSQLRVFDPCDDLHRLLPTSGVWSLDSANLAQDGSFETSGWRSYIPGAALDPWGVRLDGDAVGTNGGTDQWRRFGLFNLQLVKTGGAAGARFYAAQDFVAEAGVTYRVSIDLLANTIAGGARTYGLWLNGNYGDGGVNLNLEVTSQDATPARYQTLTLDVPVATAATLHIFAGLVNCDTADLHIDNLVIIKLSPGYLTYADQDDAPALLVSNEPFSAGDFDIQAHVTYRHHSGQGVKLGLVCQHVVNSDNYLRLVLDTKLGVMALDAVRAGQATTMASVPFVALTDVRYRLRLVHRGGHFWAFAGLATDTDWAATPLEFRWGDNGTVVGVPCNTNDGTGGVGLTAWVYPVAFVADAFDDVAVILPVSLALDFALFPSTGTVQCDDEQIGYTGKTADSLTGLTRAYNRTQPAPHLAGARVTLITGEVMEVDDWMFADTEPNWNTQALIARVAAMSGVFGTAFSTAYPRPGTGDPDSVFQPVVALDYTYDFLAIDQSNLDLTATWYCANWLTGDSVVKIAVLLRASTQDPATAQGYLLELGCLDLAAWARLLDLSGGISSALEQFTLLQPPSGPGPHRFRVVAREAWLAIYCDDALMGTFRDTRYGSGAHNYVALASVGGATWQEISVPELYEWRDTAWVDVESSAQGTLESVVIDDRPVYMVMRAPDQLYFSMFDTRQTVLNPAEGNGAFVDLLYDDQAARSDTDLVSMLRVYAVTILEQIDPDLAREWGYIYAARQMPRAENANAVSYIPRLFRRSREIHGARTQDMPANLSLQVEDLFLEQATPAGGTVGINQYLIVGDMQYHYNPADFTMQLGLRHSADTPPVLSSSSSSRSPSRSASVSFSPGRSPSRSLSPSASTSPTRSPSMSASRSTSRSSSSSLSPSVSRSNSRSSSLSPSRSSSRSGSASFSPSMSASASASPSAGFAPSTAGYIHMHPSHNGFVYDDGVTPFIPVSVNSDRLFHRWFNDDPISGREYSYFLGARGADAANTASPTGYTFDAFIAACAAAGVNNIRIWFGLGAGSAEGGAYTISFEPIPLGRYYLYDVALTGDHSDFLNPASSAYLAQVDGQHLMTTFPTCRWPNLDNAHCGSTYGPKLQASFVTRVLAKCEEHHVKVHLVLFAITEFFRPSSLGWAGSAWNVVNGGPCNTVDDFFTNASAWAYQKRRVDFILRVWGDSTAIWSFDVFNEIEFAGTLLDTTRQAQRVAWAQNMCNYVKTADPHHRPVSSSGFPNPSHPDLATMNTKYAGSSHDFAIWHDYNNDLIAGDKARLRANEAAAPSKLIHVNEMWPWSPDDTPGPHTTGLGVEASMLTNPPTENAPYNPSLWHTWLLTVGSAGGGSSDRWNMTGLTGVSGMDQYTQLQMNAPIVAYLQLVDWSDWNPYNSRAWDANISATNSDFSLGRGDGNQVMLMLHGTADSVALTLRGLDEGTYTVRLIDPITGNVAATSSQATGGDGAFTVTLNLSNATLDTLSDGQPRLRMGIVLAESL